MPKLKSPAERAQTLADRHRRRATRHIQPATADEIALLFWRAKGRCAYCSQRPADDRLQIEHAHPLCLGGSSAFINLFPVCPACGAAKGRTSLYALKTPAEVRALHRAFHRAESDDERTLRDLVTTAATNLGLDATDHLTSTLLLATLGDLLDRLGSQQAGDGQDQPDPVAQHVRAAAAIAHRLTHASAQAAA